jgi:TPR repeat protein
VERALYQRIVELRFEKRAKEAVDLVRGLAEEGDVAAKVAMARGWEAAGLTSDQADALVDAAHEAVRPDDVEAHLELSSAYATGLGNVAYDVQARRSFEHLVAAAESGAGANYSLRVGRILLTGALSVPPNVEEAKRWYKRAVAQGSDDALDELERYFTS